MRERGQALLIILLVLAVSLTVVLSSASRSVTDIQTSGLEEDSLRAFNAAEVGIEEALIQQVAPPDEDLSNESSYSVDFTVASPDGNEFVHPAKFYSGDTATIWFVSHDANGNLNCNPGEPCVTGNNMTICWGNTGTAPPADQRPAIEVSIYYDNVPANPVASITNNYQTLGVARRTFDPNPSRVATNNFTPASGGCTGGAALGPDNKEFAYSATINYNPSNLNIRCRNRRGCLLMARIKFLYNESVAHSLGVRVQTTAGTSLPAQGAEIESTGVAGDSTRRINVYQSYPEIPSLFESALFSKGSLSK